MGSTQPREDNWTASFLIRSATSQSSYNNNNNNNNNNKIIIHVVITTKHRMKTEGDLTPETLCKYQFRQRMYMTNPASFSQTIRIT